MEKKILLKIVFEHRRKNQILGTSRAASSVFISNLGFDTDITGAMAATPEEALKIIKQKTLRPTWDWDDISASAHEKAFTVAKAMKADLLQDLYDAVSKAKDEGQSLAQVKKELIPKLQAHGWWGKQAVTNPYTGQTEIAQLGSNARVKTIVQTNLQSSYGAARYKRQAMAAKFLPYWMYKQKHRTSARDNHKEYDGKVFRWDDPIWKKIYPPQGYNCACEVVALSEKDLKRMGLSVTEGKDVNVEVDEGWGNDVSKQWKPDLKKYNDELAAFLARDIEKPEPKPKPKPVVEPKPKPKPKPVVEPKPKPKPVVEPDTQKNPEQYLDSGVLSLIKQGTFAVGILPLSGSSYGGIYRNALSYSKDEFISSFSGRWRTAISNGIEEYGLHPLEALAIVHYTVNLYIDLNSNLRQKTNHIEAIGLEKLINSALAKIKAKAKPKSSPPVVYRGQIILGKAADFVKRLEEAARSGEKFGFEQFTSSSVSKETARLFARQATKSLNFKIMNKSGVLIKELSTEPRESEVLFPTTARFVVTSLVELPSGSYNVTLTEVE